MKKNKEKISFGKIIKYGISALFILLLAYFLTFIWIRPFDNTITQDRSITKFFCEMQANCNAGKGDYPCSHKGQVSKDSESSLKKWDGYNGCNESTEGYKKKGYGGYIYIEACNCGGLM